MTTDTGTAAVIDRFNQAFLQHEPALLTGLVADDCVMESIEPAPEGTRYEGGDACLAMWRALAADTASSFRLEAVDVMGERAVIRWRYLLGPAGANGTVRGVNLMHVRDGRIVEGLGYAKSGDAAVAAALARATDS